MAAKEKRSQLSEKTKKAISVAMRKNKNSQKWTESVVIDILQHMIDNLIEQEIECDTITQKEDGSNANGAFDKTVTKTVKFKVPFKGKLLQQCNIWNKNWFAEMKVKFAEKTAQGLENELSSPTVIGMINGIEQAIENNLIECSMSGQVNVSVAGLLLSKHGYVAKTEVKKDIKQDVKFEQPKLDPSVMDRYKAAQERYKEE